jgi:hypothetical protein
MKKFWTVEELIFLRNEYPHKQNKELCILLNRSMDSITGKALLLGLKKSEEFMNSPLSGKIQKGKSLSDSTKFKPGDIPFNKGTKGIMKSNSGSFKKGIIPHNTKENGYLSIRYTKGRPYYWIRVDQGKFVLYHRKIWEDHFGEIPPFKNIRFKNNDSLDVRIENLELIDKRENMALNTIQNYPSEFHQVIKLLKKIKTKVEQNGSKK